jgi:hypothetical protein
MASQKRKEKIERQAGGTRIWLIYFLIFQNVFDQNSVILSQCVCCGTLDMF